jgi:hypothetical protein
VSDILIDAERCRRRATWWFDGSPKYVKIPNLGVTFILAVGGHTTRTPYFSFAVVFASLSHSLTPIKQAHQVFLRYIASLLVAVANSLLCLLSPRVPYFCPNCCSPWRSTERKKSIFSFSFSFALLRFLITKQALINLRFVANPCFLITILVQWIYN